MKSGIKVGKKAEQKAATASRITASEVRAKIVNLQRIVNGVNRELARLASSEIEPDN